MEAKFSCDVCWTNHAPSKSDLTNGLAKSFAESGVSTLEDGDCFFQVMPSAMAKAASVSIGESSGKATDRSQTAETIAPGLIDFGGVAVSQVIEIYARLTNRTYHDSNVRDCPPWGINFTTTSPLTKPQAIRAFETLLRWKGIKIVPLDDHSFTATNTWSQ